MFSAFSDPSGRDFSLFSPVNDNFYGSNNPIDFNLLKETAEPIEEDDEVLGQFSNLQDLRNQSESYNYDFNRDEN